MPAAHHARRARALALTVTAALGSTIAVLAANGADAVSTERFVLDRSEALAAGELIRTAVHNDGRVTTGAELTRVALPDDVPLVYCAARAADGTIFLGTGNDGRIYRVRGETVELHAQTGQLLVSALAIGAGGALYAGTLPEGRIYRIGADGQPTEIARPDQVEHVWALVWDARRNLLFAGTGPEGKVYAIDANGAAVLWWDSPASHVMSLAIDTDGTLYAGTSDDAVVARLTAPGRAEVVYDFPGNEITALAARDGVLAVGANEFPDPPTVVSAHAKVRSETGGRAPRPRPGKGRIWRVERGGRAEQLFAQDEGHVTGLSITADGTIYAGTGKDGEIIRVNTDGTWAHWIDVEERQVLAISMEGDNPFFVTGDGAAFYRVTATQPRDAIWQSKVLDARFLARFGQLTWRGDGQLILQTRTGNVERPDDTWSDWSADLAAPGPVRSPAARFLQIRARFDRDPNATLRAVTAYFLPQNQRPRVSDVRIEGANDAATKRLRAERQSTVPDASSTYKLAWTVDNPDGDRLRYRLRFRREDQTVWREILRSDEVLTADEYQWHTESIPDGWYVVRVEASDELDNPATLSLNDAHDSEPILIDNHAPRVEQVRFTGGQLTGRAVDGLGPITRLELAVDGGEWRQLFPEDDLFDTNEERFRADLSQLDPGDHIVAVRATDAGGNIGSSEVQVRSGR